jgi:glycogen synthase
MGAMQRAMRVFRQDLARLRKMQTAAVQLIEERYTWDHVLDRYLHLYEDAQSKTS